MYRKKYEKYKKKLRDLSQSFFDGRLLRFQNGKTVYYQDIGKRWKFRTNDIGFQLLMQCHTMTSALLQKNQKLMKKKYGKKAKQELEKGRDMYTEKKSLGTKGVTWTREEYAHLGLQYYYLTVKSFQRFTEIWSLLERSYHANVFDNVPDKMVVCSIGGGPGFEGFVWKCFFQRHFPSKEFHFHVLDLELLWGEYASEWDKRITFEQWDLRKDDIYAAIGESKIDYIIISNVLCMYMMNDHSYDFLARVLFQGTQSILINSRSKIMGAREEMTKRGVHTSSLISDDERQCVLSKKKHTVKNFDPVFPNVPWS